MIKLTRIQVKVGQMQNLEPIPAGGFRRWKGRWLGFGKPACYIQSGGRWCRTHATKEILTQGLVVANRIEAS